jgi:hypothetical protein
MNNSVFTIAFLLLLNSSVLNSGCGLSTDNNCDLSVDEPQLINSHFIFENKKKKKPKFSKENQEYVHGRTIRIKHRQKGQINEIKFLFLKNNDKPKIDKIAFLKNKR